MDEGSKLTFENHGGINCWGAGRRHLRERCIFSVSGCMIGHDVPLTEAAVSPGSV